MSTESDPDRPAPTSEGQPTPEDKPAADDWSVSAAATLDEPTRRRLYQHVTRQPTPVSRDEAATALDLPRATAAFHLDRLADSGLLDVVYERRTGRTGPGAGRPSKLYKQSDRQVDLTIPERRYEFAGQLLAAALAEAERTGESPGAVLRRRARDLGHDLGEAARDHEVTAVLERYGFQPRTEAGEIVLHNCPFHELARRHTELVCGMNLCLLDGLLDSLSGTGLRA
ncbi:MAG: helix-turn-helix transcriptional regulator, partial [Micromonosporaceae bacterium]